MGKIINYEQIPTLTKQLRAGGKRVVLVGGCFDILHAGHIEFLERAKRLGDILIILLENDEKVRLLKGDGRPVNSENSRSIILTKLSIVDYVIRLPYLKNDADYEKIVKKIEPDIIAKTGGNKIYDWEKKYVMETGANIKILKRNEKYSTTRLIKKIRL